MSHDLFVLAFIWSEGALGSWEDRLVSRLSWVGCQSLSGSEDRRSHEADSIGLPKFLVRMDVDTYVIVRTETRHTLSAILEDELGYSLDVVVLCRVRSFIFSILPFVVETPCKQSDLPRQIRKWNWLHRGISFSQKKKGLGLVKEQKRLGAYRSDW